MNTPRASRIREEDVPIALQDVTLHGDLIVPPEAKGIILFSHGSGSSRNSPRNRWVAEVLHQHGLGTALADRRFPASLPALGIAVLHEVQAQEPPRCHWRRTQSLRPMCSCHRVTPSAALPALTSGLLPVL